ncbi:hypothetical protein [Streptomyces sp. Root369]|uniref:hypothetical protein n=1 Tax=Streptomyces sp. Root369 TaxID=1736523 RepID=UPI000ABC0751|nr:hypothetical protein [Streptomyces sp. Root369]
MTSPTGWAASTATRSGPWTEARLRLGHDLADRLGRLDRDGLGLLDGSRLWWQQPCVE